MDFSDTPAEAAFRAEARAWLEANQPTEDELAGLGGLEQAKLWQKRKFDAGWACIRWPKEYGGRGASAIEQVIWNQEEARVGTTFGVFGIGQGMAAPTMMAWATEEQKREHLPPLASGEHIWCQLFSEPAGGSDLAALRTNAVKDGDEWVINGQKIWTTGAHFSDYAILVLRTDPNVPKHKGLTYFFLDMRSPGVEVRPIRQLDGGAEFSEVYFSDVRIPDGQRLGQVGEGWKVAMTTLMFERQAAGEQPLGLIGFDDLLALALATELPEGPAIEDSQVAEKLVDWYLVKEGLKYFGYRQLTALGAGRPPGAEAALGKLLEARGAQLASRFATDLMGYAGIVSDPARAPLGGVHQASVLRSPGIRIAGGTDEILRNTLAEKVLGLPPEPRDDKTPPFNELPG